MDENVDSLLGNGKQVKGLDKLEALVHHRRRIDRNLRSHVPVGMVDGLLGTHILQVRPIAVQERSAGSGEDDTFHGTAIGEIEYLEYGAMLRVDGQQGGAVLRHLRHHQFAGANQTFLVRQGHGGAPSHRRQRRLQPGGADDRGHDPLGGHAGGLDQRLTPGAHLDTGPAERLLEIGVTALIGDDGHARTQLAGLLGQCLDIAVSGQGLDHVAAGMALDEIDGIASHRPSGAENGDTLCFPVPAAHRILMAQGHRHCNRFPPPNWYKIATTGATAKSPSSRSNIPPWPGMRPPESFTPK